MNRSILIKSLLYFFSFLLSIGTYCQSFLISKTSANFVSDKDFDSLLKAQYLPYAASKNISAGDFNARYPEYRPRLMELLESILQNPFVLLDKKYAAIEPGSPAFEKARNLYLGEIRKAVAVSLQNPSAFYQLFEPDFTDRILRFHADIDVEKNGQVHVTEFITIYNGNGQGNSGNNDIQRGIVRD